MKYKTETPPETLLDKYQTKFQEIDYKYWQSLLLLEKKMKKETGISDIEFFWADGAVVGIGNVSKTMKLWQFKL
jgi:hypothetical protein